MRAIADYILIQKSFLKKQETMETLNTDEDNDESVLRYYFVDFQILHLNM